MPTVVLDGIEGAEIEYEDGVVRIQRTGWVKDLNWTLPAPEVLSSALSAPGMPGYLAPYPSSDPAIALAVLRKRLLVAMPGTKRARLFLGYTTENAPPGGGEGTVFILQRRQTMITRDRWAHADGTPYKVIHEPPGGGKVTVYHDSRPVLTPVQELIATGYYEGEPPATILTAFGCVNDEPWHGYPRGYWLYVGEDTKTEDFGESHTTTLRFLNQVVTDWSDYMAARDQYGRVLPIDKVGLILLQNQQYEYGVETIDPPPGVIRIGDYPVAPFGTIFGF